MQSPKEIRQFLGLTQSEMAKACNTSIVTIAKWEARQGTDQRKPRGQAERLLALLADLKQMDLFDWYQSKYMEGEK